MTVRTGFDGGTGRYGHVLTTVRDGRDRFCRRAGTVGAGFVDGTGRYELTVGEIVDETGRDHHGWFHFDDGFTVPSRAVVTVNTVPSVNHEKHWKKWYEPGKVSFRLSSCRTAVLKVH